MFSFFNWNKLEHAQKSVQKSTKKSVKDSYLKIDNSNKSMIE
jgi:hypothetical protein